MKKLLCAALATLLAILPAACPAESADGFQPRLDPDTACTITVIGSYSNFEALEAEFDRFNEYYPDVELSYVKPDDYNNLLGTVLESSDAPNIFFSYQWMCGNEKYRTACDHMEDLSDPALGLDLGCLRPGLMSPDAEGHLLMVPLHEKISQLVAEGTYRVPLLMVMSIMSVGVAMKSALFPFEKWLPGAYTSTTSSGAAMLSSIVSKGYIFLLIKLYVRVFGLEAVESLGVCDVLFIFGAAGMVMGSISAIRVRTTRMMLAYSSVAQIGYIYFALGMGSEIGVVCAVWHAMTHSLTKSMLFISTEELEKSCGNDRSKAALRGGFYRSPVAAVAFMLGAANLVGVPLLGTFVTKILMAGAAIQVGGRHAMIALALIAVSTILNLVYLMNAAISLFIPGEDRELRPANAVTTGSLICWIVLNLGLGLMSSGIIGMLWNGLRVFA